MTLIRKTFFNVTPVGSALIDEIKDECLEHLGKMISDAEKEFSERKKKGLPPIHVRLLLDSYGRDMNIDSSCIMWEDEVCFEDEEDAWGTLVNYVHNYYGKDIIVDYDGDIPEEAPKEGMSSEDLSKAHKKIRGLLWNDLIIGLKIIKLGGNEYYCYCLNKFDDKH